MTADPTTSKDKPKKLKEILAFFESQAPLVLTPGELARILATHRKAWEIGRMKVDDFTALLRSEGLLQHVSLVAERYGREAIRYSWGPPSVYQLALSLAGTAYLSHGTAVFLHGLTDLLPRTVYVNIEQSPKPAATGGLTQESLQRAFANNQRQSNMSYAYDDWAITVINGKHTERLGVEQVRGPANEQLDVTNLERTLIDIVVRPAYAGGIFQVFHAYQSAKEEMSTNRLMATLKKLAYVYPYHQAIGFLMERAGYDSSRYEMLREPGLDFDFYLTHGLKDPEYDPKWRLFFPKGLEA